MPNSGEEGGHLASAGSSWQLPRSRGDSPPAPPPYCWPPACWPGTAAALLGECSPPPERGAGWSSWAGQWGSSKCSGGGGRRRRRRRQWQWLSLSDRPEDKRDRPLTSAVPFHSRAARNRRRYSERACLRSSTAITWRQTTLQNTRRKLNRLLHARRHAPRHPCDIAEMRRSARWGEGGLVRVAPTASCLVDSAEAARTFRALLRLHRSHRALPQPACAPDQPAAHPDHPCNPSTASRRGPAVEQQAAAAATGRPRRPGPGRAPTLQRTASHRCSSGPTRPYCLWPAGMRCGAAGRLERAVRLCAFNCRLLGDANGPPTSPCRPPACTTRQQPRCRAHLRRGRRCWMPHLRMRA